MAKGKAGGTGWSGGGLVSSADPLGLRAPPRVRQRAAAMRAALVRQPGLEHLRRGKAPLPQALLDIAATIRGLWLAAQGHIPAFDWWSERVDGGGGRREPVLCGALDAARELRRIIGASGMGDEAAACVLAVCCEDMTITAYAVEIETDRAARDAGGCTRATLDRVRHMLREGLRAAGTAMGAGGGPVAVGPAGRRMLAWLAADARPAIDGEREAVDDRAAAG